MTNSSDSAAAPRRSWAGRPPSRLYDSVDVPLLADLLAAHDVETAWSALRKRWGGIAPVALGNGARAWLVTSYQSIASLARDSSMVTTDPSAWNGSPDGLPSFLQPGFQHQDWQRVETTTGADHARLRAPLDEVLAAVDTAEIGRVARAVCEDMAARLRDLTRANPSLKIDLMREYVEPVTRLGFGTLLGLDVETGHQLFELANDPTAGQGGASLDELSFLIGGQTMRDAGGDLTPAGLLADHRGYKGASEAVLGMLSLVSGASAGLQAWLGQVLLLALTDERFARRLAGGRLGVDEALDEVLWDASPVSVLAPRFGKEGHLFGEAWIERGDAVLLAVGAAASDPAVRGTGSWDELGNRAHLAWGAGSHRCPASRPSRLIVRTAVEILLRHLKPVLTVSAHEVGWAPDLRFRRPGSLPVTLTPQ
jgi:cytochrome P450